MQNASAFRATWKLSSARNVRSDSGVFIANDNTGRTVELAAATNRINNTYQAYAKRTDDGRPTGRRERKSGNAAAKLKFLPSGE